MLVEELHDALDRDVHDSRRGETGLPVMGVVGGRQKTFPLLDGEEFRTVSADGQVLIWKVPEARPAQNLSRDEFLTMLLAQTNLRVKADPSAEAGYVIDYDGFPGWENTPTW